MYKYKDQLFLLNFVPKVCPGCGIVLRLDPYDFLHSAPHTCPNCGVGFQCVSGKKLNQVAEEMED